MNRHVYLLLPFALFGCVKEDASTVSAKIIPVTAASKAERIYTVSEFLAQPELRKKFFAMCADDPGQSERDPNCINVLSAERIASAGTTIPNTAP